MPNPIIPVRVIDGLTTTDETGKTVEVEPVRAVAGAVDVDEVGRMIDVPEAVETAGLITTNEVGKAVPVQPVRVVTGSSALNSAGRYVFARPMRGSIGSTPLPAFDEYGFEYFEDFESARILNGTNSFVGITAGLENRFRSTAGYASQSSAFGAGTDVLWGPVGGFPENQKFRITYNAGLNTGDTGTAWESNRQRFYIWYVDANNNVQISLVPSLNRIVLTRRVAGVNTSVNFQTTAGAVTATGVLELTVINGRAWLQLNGFRLTNAGVFAYPYDAGDWTNIAPANRIGRVGMYQEAYRWPVAYELAASPIYVTIDDHSNFFPRDGAASAGVAAKAISGTYNTKTPTRLAYRLVEYPIVGTGVVVQDWREMGTPTFGSGVWSGTIAAPTGGPYIAQVGYVDNVGKYHYCNSKPIIVGALLAYDGQSNSVNRSTGFTTTRDDKAAAQIATGDVVGSPAFTVQSNFNGTQTSAAIMASKIILSKLGIPVCVFPTGVPGSSISGLTPTGGQWTRVTDFIANIGKPEGVIWDQGEGDADGASFGSSEATAYRTRHAEIRAGWRSVTGVPNLPFIIVHPGRFASATAPGGTTTAAADVKRNLLVQTFLQILTDDANTFLGPAHHGQEHSDNYHYTGQGYSRACSQDAYSAAKYFYGISTPDGRGPIATSAALSGGRTIITLSFDLNGAGSLTNLVNRATGTVPTPSLAGGLYGYQVSIDDFATLQTISTITQSSNTLIITLASAAPAGTVKVRSMYGWSYDDTNLFYGTGYADSRADIPVDMIRTPLVAA